MKKNILLILALFFCGISVANAQIREKKHNQTPSNVTVFAKEGDKFWLILNGEKQNEKPAANVKVTGLDAEYYKVKVIFEDPKLPSVDANLSTRDVDNKPTNTVYEVRKKAGKSTAMVMRISSFETIKAPKATAVNNTVIDQPAGNNSAVTSTTQSSNATNTVTEMPGGQISMSIKVPGMNENLGNIQVTGSGLEQQTTFNGGSVNVTHSVSSTTTSSGIANVPVKHTPSPVVTPAKSVTPAGCRQPLTDAAFQTQLSAIKKQNFSDTKKKTAKTAISKNCLSTNQVKTILKDFSFEGDKLEMAKFAYPYTVDKENFLSVTELFSFSSSTDDLTDFLDAQ